METAMITFVQGALKWAGNKYRVLKDLMPFFEAQFAKNPEGRWIEPFMGSGVVACNALQNEKIINDVNPDLVGLMQTIRDNHEQLIARLMELFVPENCTEERFYALRDIFNEKKSSKLENAALFVYLNKHAFNGLCRYNSAGKFNVPAHSCCKGLGSAPKVPAEEIANMSFALQGAKIQCRDFLKVMDQAKEGDLVYCDPPYLGFDKEGDASAFVSYSKDGFSLMQQISLAMKAKELAERGVTTIISNHATNTAINLYKENGAKLYFIEVTRSVGAKSDSRVKAKELIAVFEPKA